MRFRREIVGALGALVLTACAAAGADSSVPETAVPSTVGDVGVLPAPVASESIPVTSATTSTTLAAATSGPTTSTTLVGAAAPGNRVLLIGDSILASTSRRYSNDMCAALVPLGWQVEVEAEVSRPISFADTVLDSRFSAGWDVVVIFLGTNYGNDEQDYLRRLNDAIVRIGDLPIVLVTVTEHDTEVHEVNDTIRTIADVYPNLSVVDWQQISSASPEVLREDGIHLTTEGRVRLAGAIAERLGPAPEQPGDCLKSVFTDDSAGSVEGSSGSGTTPRPTSTTVRPSSTATTVKPTVGATTTTVKPAGTTTSAPGGTTATTGPGTGSTTATAPASTAAPVTNPPTPPVSTPVSVTPSVSVAVPDSQASTTAG